MPSDWVNKYILARTNEMWNWWPARKMARLHAEVKPGKFRCAHCTGEFLKTQIQVDHIEAIGPRPPAQTWDSYLDRKFVPVQKLQVLCLTCHKVKTKEDVRKMRGKTDA